jgi:hypothetical protein
LSETLEVAGGRPSVLFNLATVLGLSIIFTPSLRFAVAACQHARIHSRSVSERMSVPSEARSLCVFEAPNADRVRSVNEPAQIPFTRVIEVLDLTPL